MSSIAKKFLTQVAVFIIFLIPNACLVPSAIAQQKSVDISGVWFGDLVIAGPDGKSSHDKVVLVLKKDGVLLTGSAGRSVDMQTGFTAGRVENNRVQFHLDAAGGMDFDMQLKEGHLQGLVTSSAGKGLHGEVDVQPAPELAPHLELEAQISDADKKLFDAFDACDVKLYSEMLDENLEFYQDITGKTDFAQNVTALQNRCAEGIKLRRELVEGSLLVNPVPGYGVIEAGTQRFYSAKTDGSEHLDATAKFVNIWRKTEGRWKVVEIISYDHR
ncbi:nuclear transport factor 2 family protein [Asticcacaulis benevestitus]|uniref:DUF4440 domain-containing protein n=1 Tax=Asticcacaulis benevestitus DSM 16100 = ATCC BAA-896 TaxID=1121022 RepID=V4NXF6_9CAUL|nr:nuclear transport factor 2 family protein [Asticcacaulis benevestitus]ESQ86482.1 hypothetical protein ABENE_18335 [Asticcacaulis benevestitus DSM 16100 = ATCC BAA-896]